MRAKHCVQITLMSGLALSLWATGVEAHIYLTAPTPRYNYASTLLTFAPCTNPTGSTLSGLAHTHLQVGVPFTVQWNETVAHNGHFRISLNSTTGDVFPAVTSTPQNPVVAPVLADNVFPHTSPPATPGRSISITPAVACAACTLQVAQTVDGAATVYYGCADVVVDPAGAGTGTGGAVGTGTGGVTGAGGNGTTGTGGRAGAGGATGSGGAAPGSGGAQGSGGALGTGGSASGSGGAQGSGGTPGTGGSGVGNGSGGAPTGTGTGGAGTGTTPNNASGGCNISRTTRPGLIVPLFGVLVALALRRRRNRNNGKRL